MFVFVFESNVHRFSTGLLLVLSLTCVYGYIIIFMLACVCVCVCVYCMYVRTYVRTYVCMYVRTYVCMYVPMYVYCMHVCMFCTVLYLHTHTHTTFIMANSCFCIVAESMDKIIALTRTALSELAIWPNLS